MISKSISTSTRLSEVSTFGKLLFTWIIPHCDDYGRMEGNPKILKAIVVPLCDESIEDVEKSLKELEKVAMIKRYEFGERKYLQIFKWEDHQSFRADRPRMSVYPNEEGHLEIDDLLTLQPLGDKRQPVGDIVRAKRSEVKVSEVKVSEEKDTYGEFKNVLLKKDELEKLKNKIGERNTAILIEELSLYQESKGAKYRSHYATLLNWARRKYQENEKSKTNKRKIV